MATISRRDFLKISGAAIFSVCSLLGLSGLFKFLNTETDPIPRSDFDLGSVEDFPPGSRTVLPVIPAILIHDQNGFSAISLICTHLGCNVDSRTDGFSCPCHGSIFDLHGKVISGPAPESLHYLRTEITPEGTIHIHNDQTKP